MAKKSDGIWKQTPWGDFTPPGVGTEFEEMLFDDIEADDLLWLQTTGGDANQAHRKIDDYTALNLKTNTVVTIPTRRTVYQKT